MISMAGLQSGEVTIHHDQSMTFVNFKIIKAIVRSPKKDIPLSDLLLIILYLSE